MELTLQDAVKILGTPERKILHWIEDGILPSYRIGNQHHFNKAELLDWALSHNIKVPPEFLPAGGQPDSSAKVAFSKALEDGGIFYGVGGTDKPSALRAVVDMLRLPEGTDRDFLLQALLTREALGSTGVGDGIAIPHVRNPIILSIGQPTVTLAFLEQPVDFGAMDGKPVNILFTIVSPAIRIHLRVLFLLAYLLKEPSFKELLHNTAKPAQILSLARSIEAKLNLPPPTSA